MYNYIDLQDTIVALATPAGSGAIGIIRLSGSDAISIVNLSRILLCQKYQKPS